MSVLQIRLDSQLERSLAEDAREHERTPAEHVRYILRRWLAQGQCGESHVGCQDSGNAAHG